DEDAVPQRPAHGLREMALTPRVLHQNHLAGSDVPLLAVARRQLDTGVEVDDVLATRRRVPIEIVLGRDLTEDDAGRRQPGRQSSRGARPLELHVHVLEVRLAVLVRVQMVDLHVPSCRVRAPRISSRIRSGVSGISRTRTPNGPSASSTASATSAGTGIAPASPTPLTPSGFRGDGVSRWTTVMSGISAAVGIRKSTKLPARSWPVSSYASRS